MVTGYESVRRLTHENLLPALERFMVLASRLRGLSKFHVSNSSLGLSSRKLDGIVDTISCLTLIAHRILRCCTKELLQFQAFSMWLRQEIDTQGSETLSQDDEDNHAKIDHARVLQYVRGAMIESGLLRTLDIDQTSRWERERALDAEQGSLFDLLKVDEEEEKDQESQPVREHPHLDTLICHLQFQCDKLYEGIAENQRRGVRFGSPLTLAEGNPQIAALRIVRQVRCHPRFAQDTKLRVRSKDTSRANSFST